MLKANSISVQSLRLIQDGAVSPNTAKLERNITETTRGFIYDWATFNGDDTDYKNRLQKYGKEEEYTLGSKQKCNSVEIYNIDNFKDNYYRIQANINISRIKQAPIDQSYTIQKESIISTETDIKGNQTILFWKNYHETVEITIEVVDDSMKILGYPVLISSRNIQSNKVLQILDRNNPAKGFEIFGRQMLELYYKGDSLANYVNGDIIIPLGGYQLNKCELVGYENFNGIIKSVFKVNISEIGDNATVQNMEQYVFVVAQKIDNKWQLNRIGGY